MKRDMDLVREILIKIEEIPYESWGRPRRFEIDGRSHEEIAYHVVLLEEAGLIQAKIQRTSGSGFLYVVDRLTWSGHEFLDTARDDAVWTKGTSLVLEKTGGLALAFLRGVLIELGKQALAGALV